MSTPHQEIQEWHAEADLRLKQAANLVLTVDHNGHPFYLASEVAALNSTLCGLGALLTRMVVAVEAIEVAISQTGTHICQK